MYKNGTKEKTTSMKEKKIRNNTKFFRDLS